MLKIKQFLSSLWNLINSKRIAADNAKQQAEQAKQYALALKMQRGVLAKQALLMRVHQGDYIKAARLKREERAKKLRAKGLIKRKHLGVLVDRGHLTDPKLADMEPLRTEGVLFIPAKAF